MQFMKVNYKMVQDMVEENKYGQMVNFLNKIGSYYIGDFVNDKA